MHNELDHRTLYRLPWNLTDNGISWLEPTAQCNLACDGCYRANRVQHKSFAQTCGELDVFQRYRQSDALSIAGGDPLLYPNLLDTIAEAKKRGYKPVVNTNGQALTLELLRDMKKAGLAGLTFHVDSKQGRAGKWRHKNELELCALRDELAELAASAGVSTAFNATVYPDTLEYVVPLTRWAAERIDGVQVMVFILYRDVVTAGFRYFSGVEEVELGPAQVGSANGAAPARDPAARPTYNLDVDKGMRERLTARAVVKRLQAEWPDFMPSAYLNGTEDPSSFKWLLASRIGRAGKVYGYVGPKFQEMVQSVHHLVAGRYLAYAPPSATRAGRATLLLSAFDSGLRRTAVRYVQDALGAPWTALANLSRPLHFQSVLIIQPIDMLADGRMNMCDGCPDITVWNDELVWSCRMDEQERYGRNLWARPSGGAAGDELAARWDDRRPRPASPRS